MQKRGHGPRDLPLLNIDAIPMCYRLARMRLSTSWSGARHEVADKLRTHLGLSFSLAVHDNFPLSEFHNHVFSYAAIPWGSPHIVAFAANGGRAFFCRVTRTLHSNDILGPDLIKKPVVFCT